MVLSIFCVFVVSNFIVYISDHVKLRQIPDTMYDSSKIAYDGLGDRYE